MWLIASIFEFSCFMADKSSYSFVAWCLRGDEDRIPQLVPIFQRFYKIFDLIDVVTIPPKVDKY